MSNKILRLPTVMEKTGLSRSLIYQKILNKTFPKPIKLSERSSGWLESDVNNWIKDCLLASREMEDQL